MSVAQDDQEAQGNQLTDNQENISDDQKNQETQENQSTGDQENTGEQDVQETIRMTSLVSPDIRLTIMFPVIIQMIGFLGAGNFRAHTHEEVIQVIQRIFDFREDFHTLAHLVLATDFMLWARNVGVQSYSQRNMLTYILGNFDVLFDSLTHQQFVEVVTGLTLPVRNAVTTFLVAIDDAKHVFETGLTQLVVSTFEVPNRTVRLFPHGFTNVEIGLLEELWVQYPILLLSREDTAELIKFCEPYVYNHREPLFHALRTLIEMRYEVVAEVCLEIAEIVADIVNMWRDDTEGFLDQIFSMPGRPEMTGVIATFCEAIRLVTTAQANQLGLDTNTSSVQNSARESAQEQENIHVATPVSSIVIDMRVEQLNVRPGCNLHISGSGSVGVINLE